jgi:homogentisate 1,2-dioxygenase
VLRDTLAFMFETRAVLRPSAFALSCAALQRDYDQCWVGLKKLFDPGKP